MDLKAINGLVLNKLTGQDADESVSVLTSSEKHELTFEGKELSMLRTTFNNSLELEYYKDHKKGRVTVNQLDDSEIDSAISQCIELCSSSKPDVTNEIAPYQQPEIFSHGADQPNMTAMCDRIIEFSQTLKENYPTVVLRGSALCFVKYTTFYQNSNGVDFTEVESGYEFNCTFLAKDGLKTSSFNYTGFITQELNTPFIEQGAIKNLLKQIIEQTTTEKFKGTFTGDVIFSPECLFSFMFGMISPLRDGSLMSGTSIYKDKLNQKIASEKLNLNFEVSGKVLSDKSFVTSDGFKAADLTVIEKGVLKSFLLSHRGALKTGLSRSANYGRGMNIGAGDIPFAEMIKKVKKGILLCRYSGDGANENGDFSGVAKNSYYIENGEIQYPISEIIISGNTAEMLLNIQDISAERVNFGYCVVPWVRVSGITISGK